MVEIFESIKDIYDHTNDAIDKNPPRYIKPEFAIPTTGSSGKKESAKNRLRVLGREAKLVVAREYGPWGVVSDRVADDGCCWPVSLGDL